MDEIDWTEIDRELEAVLGPPPAPLPALTERSLDQILGTRTHVRVLRVLAGLDRAINLTARDVARRGGASHARVLQVLRELSSVDVVKAAWTPTHAIYRLEDEHPLTAP
ncbi:MAG TPA: hypothetical protein VG602_02960, partial [Actinomycetota bacterium]|nr:hypothetical protein [Actinomycetota bacterium]